MRVIQCEPKRHAEAILAIFNDAIMNSTALYDYKPRTIEMMAAWFDAKAKAKYPVIGIENDAVDLMGFGSYGTFRAWPAYKYSVERSIYVDGRFRRRGLGSACCKRSSPPPRDRVTTFSWEPLTPPIPRVSVFTRF
jgi:L-amino acid N-acyltransferase YncA